MSTRLDDLHTNSNPHGNRNLDRATSSNGPIYYDNPAWVADALCAQVGDGELWFPHQGSAGRDARAVCRRCPALELCRQYALDHPELEGIWGATSLHEREAMRRVA